MDFGELIGALIVTLIILLVVFLITRELVCWYWKINEGLSLLQKISDNLENLHRQTGLTTDTAHQDSKPKLVAVETCPYCKEKSSKNNEICEHCDSVKTEYGSF